MRRLCGRIVRRSRRLELVDTPEQIRAMIVVVS